MPILCAHMRNAWLGRRSSSRSCACCHAGQTQPRLSPSPALSHLHHLTTSLPVSPSLRQRRPAPLLQAFTESFRSQQAFPRAPRREAISFHPLLSTTTPPPAGYKAPHLLHRHRINRHKLLARWSASPLQPASSGSSPNQIQLCAPLLFTG